MARAKTVLQSEFPYNIGIRCINQEWFSIPMSDAWEIFCEELTRTNREHGLLIHSFVLMSNHYHLIASTPNANISQCMQQFNHRTSRRLTHIGNRKNGTFAGRHFKCILNYNGSFYYAYKYNYRNPVAADICAKVEEYPFSTLRGLLHPDEVRIPLVFDSLFCAAPLATLAWLNRAPDPKKVEGVRYGLKRQFFQPKKNRLSKPLISEDDTSW